VQLFMGIRSLLGLGGVGRGPKDRNDDNDNDDDNTSEDDGDLFDGSSTAATSSRVPSSSSSSSSGYPPSIPPLRMGEDPVSKEVNVLNLDHRETTQEKINRVKAGFMTEAEKKAFLQTALSAGNTAESRLPLQKDDADKNGGGGSAANSKRFFASPFPSDSILRNFARGGKMGGESSAELDSQKKKREYLDMVTDPDRFNRTRKPSTSASASASPTSSEEGDGGTGGTGASKTPIPDLSSMELKTTATSGDAASTSNSAASQAPSLPSDLGVRLGMAAMANESLRRQQEQERRREIQWKMDHERRQHEQRAVELTEWQQKMAGFEAQQRELRVKEEERRMKQETDKRQAEKARLEQLMKAQEEYWAKKLANEKAARRKQLGDEGKDASDEDGDDEDGGGGGGGAATSKVQGSVVSSDSTPVNEKPATGFNPDESNLLDLVSIHLCCSRNVYGSADSDVSLATSIRSGEERSRGRLGGEPGGNGEGQSQNTWSTAVVRDDRDGRRLYGRAGAEEAGVRSQTGGTNGAPESPQLSIAVSGTGESSVSTGLPTAGGFPAAAVRFRTCRPALWTRLGVERSRSQPQSRFSESISACTGSQSYRITRLGNASSVNVGQLQLWRQEHSYSSTQVSNTTEPQGNGSKAKPRAAQSCASGAISTGVDKVGADPHEASAGR
jgi:hypothetical protein